VKERDAALDALWKHVLDHWDNDAAHGAFLEHCQSQAALDQAAMRYRGMKGDRDRGPGAEKRLTAVLMLAMSKLEVTRAEPKAASRALMFALMLFFLAGSLLLLTYLLRT
jgi:hypothetical protein